MTPIPKLVETADKASLEDLQKRMDAALKQPDELIRVQASTLWPPELPRADNGSIADQP